MAKKILVLFDTHVPYQIPLDPVFEFAHDWKPDVLVLGGDCHDFGSVSHWLADQSKHLDEGILADNYQDLQDTLLTPISKAVGTKCKKIFMAGNHEGWVNKALAADPNLRKLGDLDKNLPEEFSLIHEGGAYRPNNNLAIIHGHYTNLYHARKHVEVYHTTIFYGHVHTFQSHPLVSPLDKSHFYMGQSIGCLCNKNPGFLHNKPNAWINGFLYIYIEDNGSFQYMPVIIVKNKFYAEGRRYA